MTCFWCIATVDRLPDAFQDGMFIQEGFPENHEPTFDTPDLQYHLLCRVVVASESGIAERLEPELKKLGVATVENVWVLASDAQRMIKTEREAASGMTAGEVAVVDWFVAFQRGNPGALEQARELIIQGVTRWRWQFWR